MPWLRSKWFGFGGSIALALDVWLSGYSMGRVEFRLAAFGYTTIWASNWKTPDLHASSTALLCVVVTRFTLSTMSLNFNTLAKQPTSIIQSVDERHLRFTVTHDDSRRHGKTNVPLSEASTVERRNNNRIFPCHLSLPPPTSASDSLHNLGLSLFAPSLCSAQVKKVLAERKTTPTHVHQLGTQTLMHAFHPQQSRGPERLPWLTRR